MTLIKRQESLIPTIWNELVENSFFTHPLNGHADKTIPAVNLSEDSDNFFIDIAAPGLTKELFKINLNKNKLTVSSEHQNSDIEINKSFTRKEFGFTSFSRTFTLPQAADLNSIDASYENGILSLLIPKKEEAKENLEREISIR